MLLIAATHEDFGDEGQDTCRDPDVLIERKQHKGAIAALSIKVACGVPEFIRLIRPSEQRTNIN